MPGIFLGLEVRSISPGQGVDLALNPDQFSCNTKCRSIGYIDGRGTRSRRQQSVCAIADPYRAAPFKGKWKPSAMGRRSLCYPIVTRQQPRVILFADDQVVGCARQAHDLPGSRISLRHPGSIVLVKQSRSVDGGIHSAIEWGYCPYRACKCTLVVAPPVVVIEEVVSKPAGENTGICREINAVAQHGTLVNRQGCAVDTEVAPRFPHLMARDIKHHESIGCCQVGEPVREGNMLYRSVAYCFCYPIEVGNVGSADYAQGARGVTNK